MPLLTVRKMTLDTPKLIERFWRKVDKSSGPNGCWLWTDSASGTGYGYLGIGGRSGRRCQAHRLVYELVVGPIPEGLQIDHICRVRRCVRPDHLRVVTQRENLLAGEGVSAKNAVKTECKRGHPLESYVPGKSRQCRVCQNLLDRQRRKLRRLAGKAV